MEAAPLGLLDGIYALIVEDDTDTRQILESYLRHQGAVVTVMPNVDDALAIMRSVTPHVILSDISKPGMKGFQLIRAVRALPDERERATPAIAMTAHGADFPREEALLAGFDILLTKPIHPLVLGHYVKALYEESRTNERLQKFGRARSLKTA